MFNLNAIFAGIIGLLILLLVLAIAKKFVKILIFLLMAIAIISAVWFLFSKLGIDIDFTA